MAADSADKRQIRAPGTTASHPAPKMNDPLPCPRCESTSTKFCYYNNYNLAQPRYFCKSCRRYWTHGGTLRNVPVGGGTRKTSKRSRPCSVSVSPISTTSSSAPTPEPEPVSAHPVSTFSAPGVIKPEMNMSDVNLNEAIGGEPGHGGGGGGFNSFLGNPGQGYLTLGGYGFGSGSGYDSVWGYQGNGYLGGFPGNSSVGCNSWGMAAAGEIGGDGGGLTDENCFSWPGLAISAHAKGLK